MQIKKQDKKQELIEVVPESLDDLWHLSHIVEVNDSVSTLTTRRIQDNNSGKTRSDRGVKKTFHLKIKVEKINFHKYTGILRFTGIITSAPEDLIPLGAHHTINIQKNQSIKIQKTWNRWSLERLKEAVKASTRDTQIIVAIEDNTTDLGIIKQYGIDYTGPVTGDISGKRNIQKNRQEKIEEYYRDITDTISKNTNINRLILVGPGFRKNDYYNYLQDNNPELAKKTVIENTGSGGHAGIQEVLKNGLVERLADDANVAKEAVIVNKLLEEIGKSSQKVEYGLSQTQTAANMGAVEKLLVLDELVREKNTQQIMNTVENMGGNVMIISSQHDAGAQLEALGSIAGFLRYPV